MNENDKSALTHTEFLALLELMMCSDPWPVEREGHHETMTEFANRESRIRGFEDWVVAYHEC